MMYANTPRASTLLPLMQLPTNCANPDNVALVAILTVKGRRCKAPLYSANAELAMVDDVE